MALLPSIMSLFGGGPKADTTPPPAPQASQGVQQQQQATANANPTVPSQTTPQSTGSVAAIPPAGQGAASPLDNFPDLWKADPNPQPQVAPTIAPNFNLDGAKLMEQAKKIDFLRHVPAELVTKATAGDIPSLLQIINEAAQYGFASATAASGEIVKSSLTTAQGVLRDNILPGAFREQAVSQALTAANPIFADPAVAPMMGMLKQQLMLKNPTATPQEIADTAARYLDQMSGKLVSASGGQIVSRQEQQRANGGYGQRPAENWEVFFDVPAGS